MINTRARLSLVEYGTPKDLLHDIQSVIGLTKDQSTKLLTDAGSRVKTSLGFSKNPIRVDSKGTRATRFAGLIRLAPTLELEIAPKFLEAGEHEASWREDFFFLSTLSRHGRLLATERLTSSSGAHRDLSTLVARSINSMYEARKRRPLRTYRRGNQTDFFIDGEVDPIDLVLPNPEGFKQEVIQFDRKNLWNADIVAGARELLPEVRDPAVASNLVRLIEELSPQNSPQPRKRRIPARHASWAPLHQLSLDVLKGLGIRYNSGHAHTPGYLVDTWRVWEDLITIGARLGFGRSAVASQKEFKLGARIKEGVPTETKPLNVRPDCIVDGTAERPQIIIDAKYKGHSEKGSLRISESDVYEALAFSKATGCKQVALAYPAALPTSNAQPVGTCNHFETIKIEDIHIKAVQVESRGISKSGALKKFSETFSHQTTMLFI